MSGSRKNVYEPPKIETYEESDFVAEAALADISCDQL